MVDREDTTQNPERICVIKVFLGHSEEEAQRGKKQKKDRDRRLSE